jgi:exopolyphosphatase/guanosine-5'-triphosphate,3'-diphosphate pyrophosphatase
VQSLARRCNWPESHSRHVAFLATTLFDNLAALHELGARDRELLEYAALLHDIGEHVDHEAHDRHAAYLVRYGRLRGFDPREIAMLTALVRWHRRGDPKASDEYLAPLDAPARTRVRRLTALLRIADGLDRGRRSTVRDVTAGSSPSLVTIRVHAEDDPELELWGARRKRELFEKVFDRDVEFVAVRTHDPRTDRLD